MTTLYRSPSHLVDGFEWYAGVEQNSTAKRPTIVYRFRPHGKRVTRWSSINVWPGKLPKGLKSLFHGYRRHIDRAMLPLESRAHLP